MALLIYYITGILNLLIPFTYLAYSPFPSENNLPPFFFVLFCFLIFIQGARFARMEMSLVYQKLRNSPKVLKSDSQWPLFQVPWLIHDYFSSTLGSRYFSSRYWAVFRRKPKGRKQERTRNLREEKMQGEPMRNTHGFVSGWSYIHPPLGKRIGAGSMSFSTALAIPRTYPIYL